MSLRIVRFCLYFAVRCKVILRLQVDYCFQQSDSAVVYNEATRALKKIISLPIHEEFLGLFQNFSKASI